MARLARSRKARETGRRPGGQSEQRIVVAIEDRQWRVRHRGSYGWGGCSRRGRSCAPWIAVDLDEESGIVDRAETARRRHHHDLKGGRRHRQRHAQALAVSSTSARSLTQMSTALLGVEVARQHVRHAVLGVLPAELRRRAASVTRGSPWFGCPHPPVRAGRMALRSPLNDPFAMTRADALVPADDLGFDLFAEVATRRNDSRFAYSSSAPCRVTMHAAPLLDGEGSL